MKHRTIILGMGSYLPQQILTNADLEKIVDTSDEWITARTGIKERRIATPDQATSDISMEATQQALATARIHPEELTHIIVATLTPDTYCPSAAVRLQYKLGIKNRVAFDINAACAGFLYALYIARSLVALDIQTKVLVVGADILTSRTNWKDRHTCVLFGDGAGAVIVAAQKQCQAMATIDDIILSSDGAHADLLTIKGGGSAYPLRHGEPADNDFFIQMSGQEVFKLAVRNLSTVVKDILEKNGITKADIDLFIPHQANMRIIDAVASRLGFSKEKCFTNVQHYGNTSAASIPIALVEAFATGCIRPGARVLLATFGGGMTWGAGLLQF
ncbi:3-oxoacyl-(acyl carrier protein) synthase 3 [Desulfovibrionales bacterium]